MKPYNKNTATKSLSDPSGKNILSEISIDTTISNKLNPHCWRKRPLVPQIKASKPTARVRLPHETGLR